MANLKNLKIESTVTATNISGTNTGDVTLAAVGSTPSANGASLSNQVLTLQPADATHPGVITAGAQSLAGDKTTSGRVKTTETSTSTTHSSNAIQADGGMSTKRNIYVGNATSGQGGQVIFRNDTGTAKWASGLDITAGAVDFVIYDRSNSRAAMTINTSSSAVVFFGSITAPSFIGDIDGGTF